MSLKKIPLVTALWVNGIYFLEEHWDRLRVIGKAKDADYAFGEITFLPFRQKVPGADERTEPQMKDPIMAEILSGYNTVSDLCDFIDFPYTCNIPQESSEILGRKIKQLLRASNNSHPNLFPEFKNPPSSLSILDKRPNRNRYLSHIPVLDIHAYDNTILVSGGPIADSEDWVVGYPVQEVDYSKYWSFRGFIGKDIILPSSVEDNEIGNILKTVWKAKKKFLEKEPANP